MAGASCSDCLVSYPGHLLRESYFSRDAVCVFYSSSQQGSINNCLPAPLRWNRIGYLYKFTYLGSSVSSTETNIDTRQAKAWTAIDRLSVVWKSDLTDKIKCSFFQATVVLILLYGCTTWMLTKRMEKKLDGNYKRMLWAILNKFWRQHSTKQQMYGHLRLTMKTIKIRVSDVLLWTPSQGWVKAGCPARTYSSSVPILDVARKTCQKQWMIGRGGERGSGISILMARQDKMMTCLSQEQFEKYGRYNHICARAGDDQLIDQIKPLQLPI